MYTCILQVGVYAGYTSCWCSEVYVNIPLSPIDLRLYPHKPPPQQVVYLACQTPSHALYMIYMTHYQYIMS